MHNVERGIKSKIFWRHVIVWSIWLFMNMLWVIVSWATVPVIPTIFNVLSLVLVFYAHRWVGARYWEKILVNTHFWVNDNGLVVRKPTLQYYLWRWPVLAACLLAVAYVAVCWFAEGWFVSQGWAARRAPSIYYYSYSRWVTESLCVCAGQMMAALEYHFRKERLERQALEEGYQKERDYNNALGADLKNVISHYKKENDGFN
jgi:hypothetical protein